MLFKKILTEKYGEKLFIKMNHLIHDNYFAETIYCALNSESVIVIDNTGYFSEFMKTEFHNYESVKEISAASNIQEELNSTKILLVNDINNLDSETCGKIVSQNFQDQKFIRVCDSLNPSISLNSL
jgi:hypothetical protein